MDYAGNKSTEFGNIQSVLEIKIMKLFHSVHRVVLLTLSASLIFLSQSAFSIKPFDKFLSDLTKQPNPVQQDQMVNQYIMQIIDKQGGLPLIENRNSQSGVSDVVFLYREPQTTSPSSSVLLFGEFNGVSPNFGPQFFFFRNFTVDEAMQKVDIPGFSPLFYRKLTSIENDARLNYKFITLPSFNFIFDPLNPETTPGGFGGDSVFKMQSYCSPKEFNYNPNVAHGTVYGANNTPLVPKPGSPVSDPTKDPTNVNKVLNPTNPIILSKSMRSFFVNNQKKDQGYWVYLPPNYDPHRSPGYPVVYMLDGADWIAFSNINNIVDNLINKKLIEPVILVLHDQQFCENSAGGINSNGIQTANCFGNNLNSGSNASPVNYEEVRVAENDFRGWVNPDTNQTVYPMSEFINQLIAEVDSKYNTLKSPEGRALAGVSSTSVTSLIIPLYNPELIGKSISLSGVYETLGNFCELYNTGTLAAAHANPSVPTVYNIMCLTDGNPNTRDSAIPLLPNAPSVKVYISWGTYETPFYDLVDFGNGTQTPAVTQNQDMVNQLIARGNEVVYTNPPMGHSYGIWATEIGDALRTMFPGKHPKATDTRTNLGLCDKSHL